MTLPSPNQVRVLTAAFVRGLLFRVGESATKGRGDVVVFGLCAVT